MANPTHSDFPAVCSRVQRKLEHWRQRHRPRARIWREAAELACTHGINRTARALRLDYYSLKERVEQQSAAAPAPPKRIAATTFLELAPVSNRGFATSPVNGCECTLELENSGGAKMRVHLKGAEVPDLAALSRSFWNPAS